MIEFNNIKELTDHLCQKEGKKKGVDRAQMNEVVAILSDACYRHRGAMHVLYANGKRRAARSKK